MTRKQDHPKPMYKYISRQLQHDVTTPHTRPLSLPWHRKYKKKHRALQPRAIPKVLLTTIPFPTQPLPDVGPAPKITATQLAKHSKQIKSRAARCTPFHARNLASPKLDCGVVGFKVGPIKMPKKCGADEPGTWEVV